jgi:acetyltransferase-like isoleucine patch superfamily enzyme
MKLLPILFLALLPSFIGVPLRRLLGQKIGKGTKISFGTIIISNNIIIGNCVKLGPLTIINASHLFIDDNTVIKSLSVIFSSKVYLGKYVHISPFSFIIGSNESKSIISVGDHSRFFPFCWLEPGEGIKIGRHVGIGGHTLIFTHGSWSNYLKGGPKSYGPVEICDNVWLAWRVFVMPNVKIEKNAIISANSFVVRDIPENSIAAGNPARIIGQAHINMSFDEIEKRLIEIIDDFNQYININLNFNLIYKDRTIQFYDNTIINIEESDNSKTNLHLLFDDVSIEEKLNQKKSIINFNTETAVLFNNPGKNLHLQFVSYLRKYGVRLYIQHNY